VKITIHGYLKRFVLAIWKSGTLRNNILQNNHTWLSIPIKIDSKHIYSTCVSRVLYLCEYSIYWCEYRIVCVTQSHMVKYKIIKPLWYVGRMESGRWDSVLGYLTLVHCASKPISPKKIYTFRVYHNITFVFCKEVLYLHGNEVKN